MFQDFIEKRILILYISEITVDTFMLMSGLLLIRNLTVDGFKPFNPMKVLIKRYCRLMLPIAAVLLMTFNFIYIPEGPLKKELFNKEMEACNKNWWLIFLAASNYVDQENMCYPLLWTVFCDFHLAVIGTLITWVFMRNRRFALQIFSVGFIASIALPAIFAYMTPNTAMVTLDFRMFNNYRKYIIADVFYTSTHFRSGSYFVGMAVGYVMSRYNPVTHRNIISKKYSVLSFCAFMVAIVGFIALNDVMLINGSNAFGVASFVSLKRVVWAILVTILIVLCEYGTLPWVSNMLTWSAWIPISRLSYGIYLTHVLVILNSTLTTRLPPEYNLYGLMLTNIGTIVVSSIVSFLLWIFFEGPTRIIVAELLKNKTKQVAADVKKENNTERIMSMEKLTVEEFQINDGNTKKVKHGL